MADAFQAKPNDFLSLLSSYLVVEQWVGIAESLDYRQEAAIVTVSVRNSAPDAPDYPTVRFTDIDVRPNKGRLADTGGRWGNYSQLGTLDPGQTREVKFTLPMKETLDLEFRVDWQVDAETLFRFSTHSSPTDSSVHAIRGQLLDRLNAEGVEALLAGIVAQIGEPGADMPLRELSRLKASLSEGSQSVAMKLEALDAIGREFRFESRSALGSRVKEFGRLLAQFREALDTIGEAIDSTDIDAIQEAVSQLKDVQVDVVRAQDTVRVAAGSD